VKTRGIALTFVAMILIAGIARSAGQTPDQERAVQDMRDARSAAERHRAELMKIPHVRVVTGEVNSRSEAAILIEVDDQKNVDEVMRKAPSQIEGFPVEVDEQESAEETQGDFKIYEREDSPDKKRFPTIDQDGYYHHNWLKRAMPAATPGASR
jgi:hypothetical protein